VDAWSSYVVRYFDYDLVGAPPALRPSPKKGAILGDAESQFGTDVVERALAKLRGTVRFLHAPRGIMNGAPLYSDSVLASWTEQMPGLSIVEVPDVNHYTILIGEPGARAVAAEIRTLL
jgi:hypothetical protein